MTHRSERISEALREELGELIAYEMADPRVSSVIVTDVEISPDMKHARVLIAFSGLADQGAALLALNHARSFLRREVAHRLELFRVPELHFEADVSPELRGRMGPLFRRIRRGRPRDQQVRAGTPAAGKEAPE